MNALKTLMLAAAVTVVGYAPLATAQERGTVEQFISGFSSIAESQCQNRGAAAKQLEAQGKLAEAQSVAGAEAMICDCMPGRASAVLAKLSKKQKAETLTEDEFQSRFAPQIVDSCAAAQLRANYSDGCAAHFAGLKPDTYCSCMHQALQTMPDADLARLGQESAVYAPAAAEAKKRGELPPEPAPGLKKYMSVESTCSVKAKGK